MDKKTIIKIADLAKIEIKDDKINDITTSLEKILNLVDEMNSINTDQVTPMSHPLNLKQELRKDEVKESNQRELFQKDNTFEKIKKISDIHQNYLDELSTKKNISKVRMLGTIAAFDYNGISSKYGSEESRSLKNTFMKHGLLLRPLGNTIYLMPPFCK